MPSLPPPNDITNQVVDETALSQNRAIKNIMTIFGNTGTQHYSGYFLEEPNTKWRDENRVDLVEEMRRTDGAVKSVLNAIKAPVNAAEWRVDGGDEKVREFVKKNIFSMRRTWRDFVREAFGYLDFGHYVFELIFEKGSDRMIHLVDLAPRIPRSIQKWQLSDGRPGITQIIRNDETTGTDVKKTPMPEIPMWKLLVLTNDKEGDDVTGQSILRSAYKHYKYKDLIYRFQGIAAERYAVGIPTIKYPENFGDAEKAKAEELGSNLRSNEKSYMALPKSWEVDILTPKGHPLGSQLETAITHHNNMIMLSVLATFLNLGTGDAGSFALSKDQSSFFLKHVEDKCNYFAEQFSEQVIKRLVRINFGEQEEFPRLSFAPLGDFEFKEMSDVFKTLVDTGIMEITPEMKQFIYKMFKLPEITDEQVEQMKEEELVQQMEAMDQQQQQDDFAFADSANQDPSMQDQPDQSTDDLTVDEPSMDPSADQNT